MQKRLSIGVDIGGTHITCAAVRIREGQLIKGTISRSLYNHESPASVILESWAIAVNNTLSKIDTAQLAGIGFAIPGPFDYQNGISKMQHKFKKLYDLHIPSALYPLLSCSRAIPMRFLNDATCFAIGEAWLGQGKGMERLVGITLGTGFGSAFIEKGVPVVAGDWVPQNGCLWDLPFREGIADDYFSTRWFTDEYQKRTGEKVSGVQELMEKTPLNVHSRDLFEEFGQNLAACIAVPLQKFGAEVLVIGGNIANTLPAFEKTFREGLDRAGVVVKITSSKLMENAALIGSARLLDDAFWEKVSLRLPGIQ